MMFRLWLWIAIPNDFVVWSALPVGHTAREQPPSRFGNSQLRFVVRAPAAPELVLLFLPVFDVLEHARTLGSVPLPRDVRNGMEKRRSMHMSAYLPFQWHS